MSLAELAAEQNQRRLARKQAADHATEEYLLGQLEESDGGERGPSMQMCADKWGVSRGMIEKRLWRLRHHPRDLPPEEQGIATFLGGLLNDMAKAVEAAKHGQTTTQGEVAANADG